MAYLKDGGFTGFLYSMKETGRKLGNGAKEVVENFISGFGGHGWKLWEYVKGKWKLEIDTIVVRESMLIFEMLISKIRAIIGAQAITQGHGKVKSARISEDAAEYLIELEDENVSIEAHDFIRCQTFTGGNAKMYHVEVSSVDFETRILHIPITEFESDESGMVINAPAAGDELVQFGNSQNKARQAAIYLHADESGQPAIDVMFDIDSKNWEGKVKIRLGGNIPGTDNKGFYCENGMIRGVSEDGTVVYQINPDGSGFLGSGGIKWEKNGNPQFTGTILVKVDDTNVWTVTEEGANIIGDPKGKRIELTPRTQDIRIFDDDNNLVNIFKGSRYNSLDDIFSGTIPKLKVNFDLRSLNATDEESSTSVDNINLFDEVYFFADTNLKMNFKFTCFYGFYIREGSGTVTAGFELHMISYKNIGEEPVNDVILKKDVPHDGMGNYYYDTESVNIAEGFYYKFEFKLYSTIYSDVVPCVLVADVLIKDFIYDFVKIGYKSEFFANGFALGTSTNNIFSTIKKETDSGESYMEIEAHNADAGFKIGMSEFLVKQNNFGAKESPYAMVPRILSAGIASVTPSGAQFLKVTSFNKDFPTIVRLSPGKCRITYPPSWRIYEMHLYGYVMLTGLGKNNDTNEYPIKATVDTLEYGYCDIMLSDDATPNDGRFFFEIKML